MSRSLFFIFFCDSPNPPWFVPVWYDTPYRGLREISSRLQTDFCWSEHVLFFTERNVCFIYSAHSFLTTFCTTSGFVDQVLNFLRFLNGVIALFCRLISAANHYFCLLFVNCRVKILFYYSVNYTKYYVYISFTYSHHYYSIIKQRVTIMKLLPFQQNLTINKSFSIDLIMAS